MIKKAVSADSIMSGPLKMDNIDTNEPKSANP